MVIISEAISKMADHAAKAILNITSVCPVLMEMSTKLQSILATSKLEKEKAKV